jgi:hypothetical protein
MNYNPRSFFLKFKVVLPQQMTSRAWKIYHRCKKYIYTHIYIFKNMRTLVARLDGQD